MLLYATANFLKLCLIMLKKIKFCRLLTEICFAFYVVHDYLPVRVFYYYYIIYHTLKMKVPPVALCVNQRGSITIIVPRAEQNSSILEQNSSARGTK